MEEVIVATSERNRESTDTILEKVLAYFLENGHHYHH